jgi:hypothetical protein
MKDPKTNKYVSVKWKLRNVGSIYYQGQT